MILPKKMIKAVSTIVNLLDINKPEEVTTKDIASMSGVTTAEVNRARRMLENIGSLESKIVRNPRMGTSVTTYTLLDPGEVIASKIAALKFSSFALYRAVEGGEKYLLRNGVVKDDRTVTYTAEEEPTKFVLTVSVPTTDPKPLLGSDIKAYTPTLKPEPIKSFSALAPLRKSEARALVEATRQYLGRWDVANAHAKALFDAHLIDDPGTILNALKLDHRPEMDAVALVIPYIDELERTITNLGSQIDTLRGKASKFDDLEIAIRKLREQNNRLIADSVSKKRNDD